MPRRLFSSDPGAAGPGPQGPPGPPGAPGSPGATGAGGSAVICFAAGAQGHDYANLVVPVGFDAQTIDPSDGKGWAVLSEDLTLDAFAASMRGDVANAGLSVAFELHRVRAGADVVLASVSLAADVDSSASTALAYAALELDELYVLTVIDAPPVINVCTALSASVSAMSAGTIGPTGPTGVSAFTATTANFTQPAIGSTAVATVLDSTWIAVGQDIFLSTSGGAIFGWYTATAKSNSTHVTLRNLGYPGSAPFTNVLASGGNVNASGARGAAGAAGAAGATGPTGPSLFGFSAQLLTSLVVNSAVPLGFGATTSGSTAGLICTGPLTITQMRAAYTGNGLNAGTMFVSLNLYKNGVLADGNANVVGAANANLNASAPAFTAPVVCVAGDVLTVLAMIAGGPLTGSVSDISVGIS